MASHDYEEFIAALNAHGVRYLVVGAHAVAFHARPRATKDLDIFIEPTAANAEKVLAALKDFFGGADLGYTVDDLTAPDWIVQLGVAPVRIDLLAEILGFSKFEDAWKNRVEAHFGSVPTHYIGLDDLIHAKQSAGRLQDRADVRVLSRLKSSAQRARRAGRRHKPRR